MIGDVIGDALSSLVLGMVSGAYGSWSAIALVQLRQLRRYGPTHVLNLETGDVHPLRLDPRLVRRIRIYAWSGVALFVGHLGYRITEIVRMLA